MPNKPATPARTIRLSDETMSDIDQTASTLGLRDRSEVIRQAVERFTAAANWLDKLSEALGGSDGIPLEALAAADEAAWLDVHMPRPEADRRLIKALAAARPYLVAAERKRVLEDVTDRLRGFGVDPAVISHFADLADAIR